MIYFKIDGVDLDIPKDLELSFQKKNILFSFDDIELNRSQGFTLPHSKINDMFFGFSYRPDFDGGIMRVSHDATMYYSGGAERGVLSCIGVSHAGYDCVFVYGELQKLKQIKEAGNIEKYFRPSDYLVWGDVTTPVDASSISGLDNLSIVKYVNDIAGVGNGINLLPSVRLDWLIAQCAWFQGLYLTMPPVPYPQPRLILNTTNGLGAEVIINYQRDGYNLTISPAIDGAEVCNLSFMCFDVFYILLVPIIVKTRTKCMGIRFNRKIEVQFKTEAAISTNDTPYARVAAGQKWLFESGEYFTFIDKDCTCFPFEGGIYYPYGGIVPKIGFGTSAFTFNYNSFFGIRQQDDIDYNVDYYLKDNLPEVTLIDLLKVYAHIYNALLFYDVETNTVSFFDGNFTSEPIPLDNKLIKIEKITRTIGTYAQKNKVECDSDDYVQPEWKYKFSYDIANENLEKEKVITKIPFSEGNVTFNGETKLVKISDIVKDGDDWKVVAKKPTIAFAGTNQTYMERFRQIVPRNAVNDIFDLSTTIEVSVTMYLFEFQSIKPKTTFILRGKVYAYFSGTWSKNIAKLVLIKIK